MEISRNSVQRYYKDEIIKPRHVYSLSVDLPEIMSPRSYNVGAMFRNKGTITPLADFLKRKKMIQSLISPRDMFLEQKSDDVTALSIQSRLPAIYQHKNSHRKIVRLKLPSIKYQI